MTVRNRFIAASLAALALFAWTSPGHTAELTPEAYVRADIEAREATLASMEERLALLQAGGGSRAEMAALTRSQAAVESAYRKYGTSARAHGAYAATHARDISAWLKANPDATAHLMDLRTRFQGLSGAFDSVRGR
ncbi:hypothetical protein [Candidatus Accumulibacter vicinus]|uniref:Uncharacterized protein n=1 Tax=Candidatus Accumulibacter vicinus TaxID=2954382 RepID=A0A084Y4W2_9PROT|nr:hypothetical protein [Candidatus Accumulibacter vicinus]KFB69756.1 MAG: hypothetical protein CAPSK01_000469 [Candidatus Accumulibacter vicinus]